MGNGSTALSSECKIRISVRRSCGRKAERDGGDQGKVLKEFECHGSCGEKKGLRAFQLENMLPEDIYGNKEVPSEQWWGSTDST